MDSSAINVVAETEIRSLIMRERLFKDTCQWAKWRSCYHPDASKTHISVSWGTGDMDSILAGAQRMTARDVVHVLTPVYIDVRNNQKALAESLCDISVRYEQNGIEYDMKSLVRALSHLERVPAEGSNGAASEDSLGPWKMLTMEVIYVRDSIQPVVPPEFDLTGARTKGVRSSYKYLTFHVEAHGGKVRDDLPGEDDEKTVREAVNRNQQWIDEI